jgi:hypothetical protein
MSLQVLKPTNRIKSTNVLRQLWLTGTRNAFTNAMYVNATIQLNGTFARGQYSNSKTGSVKNAVIT